MIIYPTVLYHKRHSITGLNYFGKTTKDPYKYNGSGTYWKSHIKKHGTKYIQTLWVSEIYTDSIPISEFALKFSKDNNIIESKEWANLIDENGLDGGVKGYIPSAESIAKTVAFNTGKTRSDETRAKIGSGNIGKIVSDETRAKLVIAGTGRTHSDETKAKQSIASKGKQKSEEHRANISITQTKLHDILTPDGFVLEQISTKELCSRFNLNCGSVKSYFTQNRAYKGFLKIGV